MKPTFETFYYTLKSVLSLSPTLPSPLSQPLALGHLLYVQTDHGLAQVHAHVSQHLGVAEVGNGLNNGLGALLRVAALEDAAANEHTITAQLHHQRRIGGGGHAARGKVDDGQALQLGRLLEQVEGGADFLGKDAQLLVGHVGSLCDFRVDGAHVLDGLDDVAGAGLALGADHGGALADAAQGLAEVAAAAHEGHAVGVLLDVVDVVGGREDFGLVDVVDADGFEDLFRCHVS